jgi:hypothetical protein
MNKKGKLKQIVIPKEQAVFWMDEYGRWCNIHGPFKHKKIIQYFNASIDRDVNGYFVAQERDGLFEKVYFNYNITPIFALDLLPGSPDRLLLNTGKVITLEEEHLFIKDDCLYLKQGDEWIKFSERVMLKLADRIKYDGNAYQVLKGATWHPIHEF